MTQQALFSILSLVGFIMLQTGLIAFALGRLFQRVNALESTDGTNAGMGKAVTRLEVQMEHLVAQVTALTADVAGLRADLRTVETRHEADLLRIAGMVGAARTSHPESRA